MNARPIEFTLNALLPGEQAMIDRISTPAPATRQRLMEMGLIKGTNIEIIRFAPMGDPIEVRVRGYRLSIRKLEAEAVIVQKIAG